MTPTPQEQLIAARRRESNGNGPTVYTVTTNAKGVLELPPTPALEDVGGLCAWLTVTFALDPTHPVTGGRREGLRGPDGHAVLYRAGADSIRFEPVKRINTPLRLIEVLTWQTPPSDGAVLPYKAVHCQQIAHIVKMLCGVSDRLTEEQEAEGLVATFLASASAIEGATTYGPSPERYAAATALRRAEAGQPRYLVDAQSGELVIGVGDLARTARWHGGLSVERGFLDGRMQALGWERVRLDGHEAGGRDPHRGRHARIDAYRGRLAGAEG